MSTDTATSPKMVPVTTHHVASLPTQCSSMLSLPLSVLLDGPDGFRIETQELLQQLGIGSIDSARNVRTDLRLWRKRRDSGYGKAASGRLTSKASMNAHEGGGCRHPRQVISAWAEAVWKGHLDMQVLQAALRGAAQSLVKLKRLCACGTDVSATFMHTLVRLSCSARSARHFVIHDGTTIDLLGWRQRRWQSGRTKYCFFGPIRPHTLGAHQRATFLASF